MTNMNYKQLLTLLLFFFSQYALAAITVQVDRDPVVVDESFQLIFTSDQKIDADPDFSPLNKSLTILNRSVRSETQIINGNINRSKMWVLTVISNKTGNINIPAIHFGKEASKPLTVNIIAGTSSKNSGATNNIFIDVEVNTTTPYVQAQLIYTVKLHYAVAINNARLSDPELSTGQAIIDQLGEDSHFETQRNGKNYRVVQRQYVIFPQSSGTLVIKPVEFQGQTGGAAGIFNFDPFGPQPQSIAKRSRAIDVDVKPIPDSFTGDTWLPANKLTIQEQWSVDPSRLKQGVATTRTLTLVTNGLAASHLPAIASNLPDTLKQYPDQPKFEETYNADGYIGTRHDKMAIIPTVAGDVTLPAIKIPWWNTDTDKMEIAELPERNIHIVASAAAAPLDNDIVVQTTTDRVVATAPENTSATTVTKETSIWKWVSLILLALWSATLIIFWGNKRRNAIAEMDVVKKESNRKHLNKIQQACRNNDATATKKALLAWAKNRWPDKDINNINIIKELSDDEGFNAMLDALSHCLYGSAAPEWDGASFLEAFKSQSFDKKQYTEPVGKLEPLYKT